MCTSVFPGTFSAYISFSCTSIGPLAALSWHAFRGCWVFAFDLDPADYCFQLTGVGDLFLYNISSFCYPVPSGTLDTNMHRGIDMILNPER